MAPALVDKSEGAQSRTFATSSTSSAASNVTVDDTLDKLFDNQEATSSAVATVADSLPTEVWDPTWYNFADQVPIVPYVFGGAGWFFASFNANERQSIDEATVVKQDPKGGPGLYGGMGVSYRASPSLALYAEALYLYRKTEVETVYLFGPPETFPANLSSLSLQIGIRYFY